MRIWPLVLAILLFSCGGQTEIEGSEAVDLDTSENAIIEHELDDERLDAVGYNNRLNAILSATLDDIDLLFISDSSNIKSNLENILFNLDLNHTAIVETPEFEEKEPFRLALLELIAFYINELNGEFAANIQPIILSGTPGEEEQGLLSEYDKAFAESEKEYFEVVVKAQEEFALKNNIRLQE